MFGAALAELVAVAWAEDDAARAALQHAVERYLSGDAAQARAELQALLAAGDLEAATRRDALFWLGEVLYTDGGPVAARNIFEALLAEAPDYALDPSAHAGDVVVYFEALRAELTRPPLEPDPPELAAPPHPWPWQVLIPGGVGYFMDGRPAAGAIVGGLQAVSLGVSIGTYAELTSTYKSYGGSFPQDREDEYRRFKTLEAVNRSFATLGVLAWLVPIPIETTRWATNKPVVVGVAPGSITVAGRF